MIHYLFEIQISLGFLYVICSDWQLRWSGPQLSSLAQGEWTMMMAELNGCVMKQIASFEHAVE